jgi:ankyrin repeat protein
VSQLCTVVNVHAKDLDKKTPLIDAVQNKCFSIISLLVQTGAAVNIQPVNLAMELCRYLLQQYKRGSIHMKFSMTGQDKGDLLIQVTA